MGKRSKFTARFKKDENRVHGIITAISKLEKSFNGEKIKLPVRCVTCNSECGCMRNKGMKTDEVNSKTYAWCCEDCFVHWKNTTDGYRDILEKHKTFSIQYETPQHKTFKKKFNDYLEQLLNTHTLSGILYYMTKTIPHKLAHGISNRRAIKLSDLFADILDIRLYLDDFKHIWNLTSDVNLVFGQISILHDCYSFLLSHLFRIYKYLTILVSEYDAESMKAGKCVELIKATVDLGNYILKTEKDYASAIKIIHFNLRKYHSSIVKSVKKLIEKLPKFKFHEKINTVIRMKNKFDKTYLKIFKKYGFTSDMFYTIPNAIYIAKHIISSEKCEKKHGKTLSILISSWKALSKYVSY